jgi:ABC-type Zn2+ transport system substrate-binding protein/surface adhesin
MGELPYTWWLTTLQLHEISEHPFSGVVVHQSRKYYICTKVWNSQITQTSEKGKIYNGNSKLFQNRAEKLDNKLTLRVKLGLAVPVIIILQTCQYYDNRICVRIMCELTLSF